jgi:protein-L-isoaspartate O-methyltransferase
VYKLFWNNYAQGIRDEHVLEALAQVPREKFVDEAFEHKAWENVALPIGQGQTISQPYMVARMTELLELTPDPACWRLAPGRGIRPRSWRIWFITYAPLSGLKVYSGRRVVA